MKIGLFADPHVTKKMGTLQDHWESSLIDTFKDMYRTFNEVGVGLVICLGDFFDKAVLEAKSASFVNTILNIIDENPFTTHMLLGNHEVDSTQSNILEYISGYKNISTETVSRRFVLCSGAIRFVPYTVPLDSLEDIKGDILVTHHDIYGEELAGGKVKANFGADPSLLSEAEVVFNGHVHLSSKIGNIHNLGSVVVSQQGELRTGEYPKYYVCDTEKGLLHSYDNKKSLIFQTVTPQTKDAVVKQYEGCKLILRVEYENEEELTDIQTNDQILLVNKRKLLNNESLDGTSIEVKKSALDLKHILSVYVQKDPAVEDAEKSKITELGIKILGESVC